MNVQLCSNSTGGDGDYFEHLCSVAFRQAPLHRLPCSRFQIAKIFAIKYPHFLSLSIHVKMNILTDVTVLTTKVLLVIFVYSSLMNTEHFKCTF
jgi:hypothetical protein